MPKEVTEYDLEGKGGPSADDLRINMRGKVSSKWNHAVGQLLLDTIRKRKQGQAWNSLPEQSDTYLLEIVTEQLERARTVWRDAQPRVKVDGTVEDPAEVEERMNEEKERKGKQARATTRWISVSSIPFGYYSENQI